MAAVNYDRITPYTLIGVDEKNLRKMYSEMRSILRKRNERMRAKGIEPPFKTPVPTKEVPTSVLKAEVAELAYQLREPTTSFAKRNQTPETKAVRSLQSKGFDIKRSQLKSFGRFMDMIRERMGERYKTEVVNKFSELQRQGVRIDVIERNFKKYLESNEKLEELVNAVQRAHANTGGVKVSDIKKELGI